MAGQRRGHAPPAELRTINMFTGATPLEEAAAAAEVIEDTKKVREPVTVESLTEALLAWPTPGFVKMDGYRLAKLPNGHYVLERVGHGGTTYNGILIKSEDIVPLAREFVRAAKEQMK